MFTRIPRSITVGTLAVALLGSGAAGAAVASASSTPVYSTSTTTKYVTSHKCLHTHIHTVRDYGYSSKAGGYIRLVRPSVSNSDSYSCHK